MQAELRRSGFEDLIAAGMVLTGGSSKMEGLIGLAEEILHMPVRLGVPHAVAGLTDMVRNPIHSTGVGLLQFGRKHGAHRIPVDSENGGFRAVARRMRNWFEGNF